MALPLGVRAINLGCGLSAAPGWINVDNSPNARLAKYPRLRWTLWKLGILSDLHYAVNWSTSITSYDLKKRLPHSDGSIDYVYTSHFLEHLPLQFARQLIKEVFRVLRPGGVARIVVPDLAVGARRYLNAIQENPSDARAATAFLEWLQLSRTGIRDPHCWMYDVPSLSALLEEIGFTSVVVCQYRSGRVPDCDILDNRPEDSLHLEAEKP